MHKQIYNFAEQNAPFVRSCRLRLVGGAKAINNTLEFGGLDSGSLRDSLPDGKVEENLLGAPGDCSGAYLSRIARLSRVCGVIRTGPSGMFCGNMRIHAGIVVEWSGVEIRHRSRTKCNLWRLHTMPVSILQTPNKESNRGNPIQPRERLLYKRTQGCKRGLLHGTTVR